MPEAEFVKSHNASSYVDLLQCCREGVGVGPEWARECEDLDITLLVWGPGKQIAPHINDEVDVVLIGIEGQGEVTVNAQVYMMRPGAALLIPKGAERAIQAAVDCEKFCYVSLHKRRRKLIPGVVKR